MRSRLYYPLLVFLSPIIALVVAVVYGLEAWNIFRLYQCQGFRRRQHWDTQIMLKRMSLK